MSGPIDSHQGARLAALFVRRPVLAIVLNALVFLAGLAALGGLKVQELPNVSRPVLTVTTSWPGAAAETVDSDVTAVVEGAVARVNGVAAISSSSRYGRSQTTVELSPSTDINIAAADVRDALARASNQLPDDAEAPVVVKADSNAAAIMRIAITADNLGLGKLTDLVETSLVDQLRSVEGVADIQLDGDAPQVVTVDLKPATLAARGLTLADVSKALATVGYTTPAGTLNATNQNIIVQASAQVGSVDEIAAVELRPGVTLGEVATVYLGPSASGTRIRSEGRPGVSLSVIAQAEANTIEIARGVKAVLDQVRPGLPGGVDVTISTDDSVFIEGAVEEVERSMLYSVLIVTAIIFLFLRDWRATLIPALSMPIAIAGALAGIYLAGFSINILTLLALVMATGLVVDDAIVVLENIVRLRNLGHGPRAAAVLGTQEVYFAVIATTATLIAVFVPISFLPGQVGGLFREFGFTLAMAVIVSTFVALSLTPMMTPRALARLGARPAARPSALTRTGAAIARVYARLLHAALQAPLAILAAALAFGLSAWAALPGIKSELTPPEDRSFIGVIVQAPQNVSLDYTNAKITQIERLIAPLKQAGEVAGVLSITGFGGSTNRGFITVPLVPESERSRSQAEISADITRAIAGVTGVRAFAISSNSLGIRGGGNGLQFALVGTDYATLAQGADIALAALSADPRFGNTRSSYDITQAQVRVRIDRLRADRLGVDITGVGSTLQAMLDGKSVGSVVLPEGTYPVYLQSTSQPVNDPTDLQNIFVRTSDGRYVPMDAIVQVVEEPAAPSLSRENLQRAITITAGLTDGFPIGAAYDEAVRLVAPQLPPGVAIAPLAEAQTIGQNAQGLLTTFGFAALVVLLVLAAQFESFVSAAIIMVTVPFGLAAAVYALLLTGGSLNIYSQIGLVLLVGIMAKNGILVVEFANQLRDRGATVREAIEQASLIRLRPIMMTKLATILGAVPLIVATGPGAEARAAMGWVIVGALGFAAVATLFLTPATYLLLAPLSKARSHEEVELRAELDRAAVAGLND